MESITLYELNNRITQVISTKFQNMLWITAEIDSVKNHHSGHHYLQLVDKREDEDGIVAEARGTIWSSNYARIHNNFVSITHRPLSPGMKVLLLVKVTFHERYGFSLNIRDIDPNYTLGDIERRRREILEQLERDGTINQNRHLPFPALPKNVAIISSPEAAGYEDFINQLDNNPYKYHFHWKLFPATMQGDTAANTIIEALKKIKKHQNLFDIVIIIRGGGARTDLSCFDSYELASFISQFPLPIITGIGHERDETIIDRVAYRSVKTPTAAAEFLLVVFQIQETKIEEWKRVFVSNSQRLLNDEKTRQIHSISTLKQSVRLKLTTNSAQLKQLFQHAQHTISSDIQNRKAWFNTLKTYTAGQSALIINRHRSYSERLTNLIQQNTKDLLSNHHRRLEIAETTMKYVDPKHILAQGYSITRLHGKAITSTTALHPYDIIETELSAGTFRSQVLPVKQN